MRQLRQAVDQAVGQSIRQVLGIRIGIRIHERQHGDGVHRALRSPAAEEIRGAEHEGKYQRPCTCEEGGREFRFCARRRRDPAARKHSRGIRIAPQALEVAAQLPRSLVAHLAVFFERLREDTVQLLGRIGIHTAHRRRCAVQYRLVDHRGRVSGKRLPPRRHLVEHHRQREEIAARVQFFPACLFRRHVRHRAERHPRAGQILSARVRGARARIPRGALALFFKRREFGQPKIQNLRLAAVGHKNIRGLDVAVDDSLRVRGVERVGNLNGKIEQRFGLDGLAANTMLQRPPLEEFHGDERHAVLLVDLVDRADARMIERGCGARLTLEALQRLRVLHHLRGEKLQCDGPAQLDIFGAIDHTHTAAAQPFSYAVMADDFVDQVAFSTIQPFAAMKNKETLGAP